MQNKELEVFGSSVLTITRWRGLLLALILRLSPMAATGEVRLIAAVLAQSISDEFERCASAEQDVFGGQFFHSGFVKYCGLIGVNSDQLKNDAVESFTLVGISND